MPVYSQIHKRVDIAPCANCRKKFKPRRVNQIYCCLECNRAAEYKRNKDPARLKHKAEDRKAADQRIWARMRERLKNNKC
jgi:hypothetical protein